MKYLLKREGIPWWFRVQSLVRERRSQKLCCAGKKKEKETETHIIFNLIIVIIILSVEYTHTFIPYIITF